MGLRNKSWDSKDSLNRLSAGTTVSHNIGYASAFIAWIQVYGAEDFTLVQSQAIQNNGFAL